MMSIRFTSMDRVGVPSQEPDRLKNLRLVLVATIGGPWQAPASSSNAGSPALEKYEVWDGTPFSSSGVAVSSRHEKLKRLAVLGAWAGPDPATGAA
jgi:hypothetical protein